MISNWLSARTGALPSVGLLADYTRQQSSRGSLRLAPPDEGLETPLKHPLVAGVIPVSMKFRVSLGSLILAAAAVSQTFAVEMQSLFDGKSLAGWTTFEKPAPPFWQVRDGLLVGENDPAKTGSTLFTEKEYHDVVFEAEVRWTEGADTGVFFRLRNPLAKEISKDAGKAAFYGPNQSQVQIGISGSLKRDMTGSIYVGNYPEEGRGKGVDALLKAGDWNKIRFEVRGDTITVWLNGTEITRYSDPRFPGRAPLGLQIHPGKPMKIELRNLRAQALD